MKIITTNIKDFVNAEIKEHGFDYVEAQFLMGYEPSFINGVWCWKENRDVLVSNKPTTNSSNTSSYSVDHSRNRVRLLVP